MKYCKDCKHFERYPSNDLRYVLENSICNRVYSTNEDPVVGVYTFPVYNTANHERSDDERCGPDAKYFERKRKWLSIF